MHTVLVVEDEARLRAAMVRRLSKIGALDVEEAGRLSEARICVRQERPQLIICDLSLPDGSGLDLLDELTAIGLECPIFFLSRTIERHRGQIPPDRDVLLLEKPITVETLVALVVDRLRSRGRRHDVQSMVELACTGGYSSVIEVSRDGINLGRIVVKSGEIWSAQSASCRGAAAVESLSREPTVQVAVRPLDVDDTLA